MRRFLWIVDCALAFIAGALVAIMFAAGLLYSVGRI